MDLVLISSSASENASLYRMTTTGYDVPLQGDFPASKMLNSVPNVSEERKQRIIKTMDVNPEWRMHQVSDGQRRRVQIAVGLLKPFQVAISCTLSVDLSRRYLVYPLKQD